MITRVVRLTIHPDRLQEFLDLFESSKSSIRAFPGCLRLSLMQDTAYANQVSTFSTWEDDGALQKYRESELFISTWAKTRPLFAARPEVYSYRVLSETD